MIKLIIFDLDDTLVDTFETNFRAYEKACSIEGITITKEDYLKTRGLGWKESISIFAKVFDEGIKKRIHENKKIFYSEFAGFSEKIFNNILLKDILKEKFPICIATSASRKNAIEILKFHNLLEDFKFIVAIEDVRNGKPAPDLFLKCTEIENVLPEECFVIDDSDLGIEAANKAGMRSFKVIGNK